MKLSERDKKIASEGYKALRGAVETEKKSNPKRAVPKAGAPVRPAPGKAAAKSAGKESFNIVLDNGRLVFRVGGRKELPLPKRVTEMFVDALEQLSKGNDVNVVVSPKEVTTQQAADYLRVSRPFVVDLLENGEIPYRKVGTHRRVAFEDLQNYKERIDAKRLNTLAELAKQAQELGMGY